MAACAPWGQANGGSTAGAPAESSWTISGSTGLIPFLQLAVRKDATTDCTAGVACGRVDRCWTKTEEAHSEKNGPFSLTRCNWGSGTSRRGVPQTRRWCEPEL